MYAILLVVTAVAVWAIVPDRDRRRRRSDVPRRQPPHGDLRVWRRSPHVVSGHVALALWLPHYYVDVYGVDLAGFLTALFIFPPACCGRSAATCPTGSAPGR